MVRAVEYDIRPGVQTDMGNGDAWPDLRRQMLESGIFILATPTWVGQMSSLAQRVIEILDAELSETDDQGRLLAYGKVAAAVIVGNEDGAHHVTSQIFQCLNDPGFTLAAGAAAYWNGEAMHRVDYKDLKETPEKVAVTTKSLSANMVHLARLLKQSPYSGKN
jgi:multimeric flavodoxin WrbA